MDLQVGVVGSGGMGARHAQNLISSGLVQIVAVADVDSDRARALATAVGARRTYQDGVELVRDPGVDAVVVASPDPTHAMYVLACLDAQKPVFCEKPLATSSQEAWSIVQREVSIGRRLVQVGFQRRYDPAFQELRQAVQKGDVGRPVLYRVWHRNVRPSQDSLESNEAVLINSAIHDLDEIRWLSRQEIAVVHSVVGRTVDPHVREGVFDLLLIQLGLVDGPLALIELNLSAAYGYEVGVEVTGDRGSMTAGLPEGLLCRAEGWARKRMPRDWLERFGAAYMAEMMAWVHAVRGGTPLEPHAWDGYVSLLVAEACGESLRTGRPVRVGLPPRPALYAGAVA